MWQAPMREEWAGLLALAWCPGGEGIRGTKSLRVAMAVRGLPPAAHSLPLVCTQPTAGSLPASWAGMRQLRGLVLSFNALSGTLPPSWAAGMAQLQSLVVDHTYVGGVVPREWAGPDAMQALRMLRLRDNALSGSLPPEWGQPGAFPQLQVR